MDWLEELFCRAASIYLYVSNGENGELLALLLLQHQSQSGGTPEDSLFRRRVLPGLSVQMKNKHSSTAHTLCTRGSALFFWDPDSVTDGKAVQVSRTTERREGLHISVTNQR